MLSRAFLGTLLAAGFAVGVAAIPGCNCSHNPGTGDGGGNGDAGIPALGSITIDPSDVTLDLVQGQPPPMQDFKVTLHASNGDMDVTGASTFALTDVTAGSMNLNEFTAATDHGGTTQLIASYIDANSNSQMALATIHVKVHGVFNGPDCPAGGCPTFPGDTAPQCTQTGITPQIFYPNDGVLLPPNMEVVAVHFTPYPQAAAGSPDHGVRDRLLERQHRRARHDDVLDAAHGHGTDAGRHRRLRVQARSDGVGLHRQVEPRR